MAQCKDCIYHKMCYWIAIFNEETTCEHFISTADVVPKSEVEELKQFLDATIAGQETLQKALAKSKSEVAREIFEEIWASIATHAFTSKSEDYADGAYDTIEWVDSKIAEVEKKYTEGEK